MTEDHYSFCPEDPCICKCKCGELAAEVIRLRSENKEADACIDRLTAQLDEYAKWGPLPERQRLQQDNERLRKELDEADAGRLRVLRGQCTKR